MKGIIGVVAQETSRYTKFWTDMEMLQVPDLVEMSISYDGNLGEARNDCVQKFLATGADWLVMIDDDHTVDPQFLRRWLYRHEPKLNAPVRYPITASLYLTRGAPFAPVVFGFPSEDGSIPRISLADLPHTGVVPVYAAGTSGMFIRRDVFERMQPPWFRLDEYGEDFHFCIDAQKLGFPVHLDVESRLGHMAPFEVHAEEIEGEWVTVVRRGKTSLAIEVADTRTMSVQSPEKFLMAR